MHCKSCAHADTQAIPVLLPELLMIVTNNEQYRPELQRRALVIMHSIVNMLSNLSGQELKQVHSLLSPMLGPWFAQFGRILSSSSDSQVWTVHSDLTSSLLFPPQPLKDKRSIDGNCRLLLSPA